MAVVAMTAERSRGPTPVSAAKSAAETLIAIAGDPAAARARAQRATVLYQGYRWTYQRDIYLDVYKGLLEAGTSGTRRTTRAPRLPGPGPADRGADPIP